MKNFGRNRQRYGVCFDGMVYGMVYGMVCGMVVTVLAGSRNRTLYKIPVGTRAN